MNRCVFTRSTIYLASEAQMDGGSIKTGVNYPLEAGLSRSFALQYGVISTPLLFKYRRDAFTGLM